MLLCKDCEDILNTAEVKVCSECGKTSDDDEQTLAFCTDCARALNVCRSCGQKL